LALSFPFHCLLLFPLLTLHLLVIATHEETALIQVQLFWLLLPSHFDIAGVTERLHRLLPVSLLSGPNFVRLHGFIDLPKVEDGLGPLYLISKEAFDLHESNRR
jgi:hypothetical protein